MESYTGNAFRQSPTNPFGLKIESQDIFGFPEETNTESVVNNSSLCLTPKIDLGMEIHPMLQPTSANLGIKFRPTTLSKDNHSYSLTPKGLTSTLSTSSDAIMSQAQPGKAQFLRMQENYFDYSTTHDSSSGMWLSKPCDERMEVQTLESLGEEPVVYDQTLPLYNTGNYTLPRLDFSPLSLDTKCSRRQSGSSFSLSSAGLAQDGTFYEDLSALSDAPSYHSDYHSRNSSSLSTTPISAVASPMRPPRGRAGSRSRASPSPRSGMRPGPYSMDNTRIKRWSTGSCASSIGRRNSSYVSQNNERPTTEGLTYPSHLSSPIVENLERACLGVPLARLDFTQPQAELSTSNYAAYAAQLNYRSPFVNQCPSFENPPSLPSHSIFRMLESNAEIDAHDQMCNGDICAEPPDVYASLHCDQSSPPPEDMNTKDPELIPHRQEVRFEGDLYTPRWVRGQGNKREGWCGICKPGRWLVLKNSAYWYDKSFSHGVSAANGNAFEEPQAKRQTDGHADVWEGLCGSCNEWIALTSTRKRGTSWFRHAYKCHTHTKPKDSPRRRRDRMHGRSLSTAAVTTLAMDGTMPTIDTKPISPLETLSSII